jgi:hypothetical protein
MLLHQACIVLHTKVQVRIKCWFYCAKMAEENRNQNGPMQNQPMFVGVIGAVPSFPGGNSEDWEVFKLTLKYFFEANNIVDDSRKKVILYTAPGDFILKTVLKQARPRTPVDLTFAEAFAEALLDRQLSPKPSSFLMRQRFKYRDQQPNESAQMFLAELRKLAAGCDFPDADNMILGQFVSGLADQDLKMQFFSLADAEELTLQVAINRAVARETARSQVAALPHQNLTPVATAEKEQTQAAVHKAAEYRKLLKGETASGPTPSTSSLQCIRCTGDNEASKCPFKKSKCNFFQRIGHIRKACLKLKAKRESEAHFLEQAGEYDDDQSCMYYMKAEWPKVNAGLHQENAGKHHTAKDLPHVPPPPLNIV